MNASAGDLALRDDAHVLTPADGDALKQVVAKAPFDARLVTTTAYADQAALSRFVGSLVAEGDMVVVGIDPTHRHVQVHFGTQSHIPEAAWPSIERAGNDAFKRGAWEEGAAAIFQSAEQSVTASGTTGAPAASPQPTHGGFIGPLVWIVLAGVFIAVIAMIMRRRAQGYSGGGYGGPAAYGGGYGPGNSPGGMGALGGGILGAGLGGIAGYELGKMEGERERGGGFDGSSGSSDGGSFDAGGGGSSWGDSGSNDGGGGGFDGGGGGDSGGGSDF